MKTHNTTTTSTVAPYPYEGAPFHARGLSAAAVFDSPWKPSPGSIWLPHERIPQAWSHPHVPGPLLFKPADDAVLIAHMSPFTPSMTMVLAMGEAALGAGVTPSAEGMFPLSVRLPMKGPGSLPLPPGDFRSRRLWPLAGQQPEVSIIEGVPVELRISGSRYGQKLMLHAEAFIGRAHESAQPDLEDGGWQQVPRALLYAGDARNALLLDAGRVRCFVARLLDALLAFAYWRQDVGLDVGHRRLKGRQIARVDVRDCDVEFPVRLPQPRGTVEFVGSWFSPQSPTRTNRAATRAGCRGP